MAAAISESDAVAITCAVVEKAKRGDMIAARLVLDRLWPAPKGGPISFAMPPMNDAAGVLAAHAALLRSIGAGELAIDEGIADSQAISSHLKIVETIEIEQRLRTIEEQVASTNEGNRG
jgi:hypothetical protein